MIKHVKSAQVGDEFPKLVKEPVTRVQIAQYAGASGDFNPLHLDDSPGLALGAGGVIAHGMLIMGFVGQAITSWVPKKALRKFGVRFIGMTRPGDSICVTGKVKEIEQNAEECRLICEVKASDQAGKLKLIGTFEATLSPTAEIILQ